MGHTGFRAEQARTGAAAAAPIDRIGGPLDEHGRSFLDSLDEARWEQLRQRLLADLRSRDELVLRRYAWLWVARA